MISSKSIIIILENLAANTDSNLKQLPIIKSLDQFAISALENKNIDALASCLGTTKNIKCLVVSPEEEISENLNNTRIMNL